MEVMMGEFMTGIFNTSIVVGMSIAVFSILLYFGGKGYRAKCRKTIWIVMAFCLLIPFRPVMALRGYTAEIPILVLREADIPTTDAAGGSVAQRDREQAASGQVIKGQVLSSVSRKEITVADVFFVIWVCVGAVMAVYFMAGYWKLQRKIRRWSHDCKDAYIHKVLKEVTDQYGMKRIPELRILQDAAAGPFTTGVLKNIIVLPDGIQSEKDMRFILKHEALHCKNKDILWKLFFLFVNMIHWFNPLVWVLRRAAEQDMEMACDEEVVSGATKADREEYSDVIMSWVEKSRHRGSVASTGYVHGVRFLKRRFDSIINGGRKKKGILLIGTACALVLLIGNMVHVQSGERVYAGSKVPVLRGIEVKTDIDGDGEEERVLVTDNVSGDYAFSQVLAEFNDGSISLVDYPDYWDSYLVTGDLSGNGTADIVLMRIATGSTYGGGEISVLHVQTAETGVPELVEYPSNFIQNPDLELKWVGWEDYTGEDIPDDEYSTAQPVSFGPENRDFCCMGAAIIEREGKTMLRLISFVDAWTESVKCIDCSYTADGWYIEDMQMIYNYWGGGWEEVLLGERSMNSVFDVTGDVTDKEEKVVSFENFWDEDISNERTIKFVTGLEITFPEEWQGKVLLEKELYVGNNIDANNLLICEKGNADAGIGGIIFSLVFYEYQPGLAVDIAYEKVLGIYKQGEKEYVLIMDRPGDRQYSEEDEALINAYLELSETQDEVVINTDNMEEFTDLEGIELIGGIFRKGDERI